MTRDHTRIGQHVIYVDSQRRQQPALVQQWWPQMSGEGEFPGCNLVVVSFDSNKDDSYGRQIEHFTSITHKTVQPADGNYWRWPDEA